MNNQYLIIRVSHHPIWSPKIKFGYSQQYGHANSGQMDILAEDEKLHLLLQDKW